MPLLTAKVTAKHAGKSHPVTLKMSDTGLDFKQAIYSCTGVPPGGSREYPPQIADKQTG